MALASLATIPWPIPALLLIGVLLLVSAWRGIKPSPWTRLVASGDGRWCLVGRDGTACKARLGGGGLRHPWLVTLPFHFADGGRCVVTVCADAVPAAEHSALRRWLAGAGEVRVDGR
jgi:hypothetical protein